MNYDGYSKYDRRVAQSYDDDRQGEAHWRAEFEWMANFANTRPLGRVLDIPVGTGRLLTAMSSADSIVGVDVSDDMLRVARSAVDAAALSNVELRKGDALRLLFDDRAFDSVVCFRLAHLLPPELVPALLAELSRVCAGHILIQVYVAAPAMPRPRLVSWLASQVRRVFPRPKLPWSHIRSYLHTWDFFEAATNGVGLRIATRHRLGEYSGSSVEVLELQR